MLFALIHAIATINFNSDHTISGVAINLLAPGLSLFLSKILFDGATTTPTIAMENKIPMYLFGLNEKDSIVNSVNGNFTGTKIIV